MKFQMEDVQIDTFQNGKGEGIRLIHKPSGRVISYSSQNGIRRATKDRLIAQLKVLVERYELSKSS